MSKLGVKYTVHGVAESTVARTVQVAGAAVEAKVPCVVVELVADGMAHSFTFIGADAAAALATFAPGAKISATFTKED